jgi:hypothetical protein
MLIDTNIYRGQSSEHVKKESGVELYVQKLRYEAAEATI